MRSIKDVRITQVVEGPGEADRRIGARALARRLFPELNSPPVSAQPLIAPPGVTEDPAGLGVAPGQIAPVLDDAGFVAQQALPVRDRPVKRLARLESVTPGGKETALTRVA
jgi:hypothetical protein